MKKYDCTFREKDGDKYTQIIEAPSLTHATKQARRVGSARGSVFVHAKEIRGKREKPKMVTAGIEDAEEAHRLHHAMSEAKPVLPPLEAPTEDASAHPSPTRLRNMPIRVLARKIREREEVSA